jgi:hypothetical protein
MKFKAQDKQNQLIENISSLHLVIGVDIAQEMHVARAVSYRGIALGSPLEFGNHDEGFRLFGRWIQDTQVLQAEQNHCGYGTHWTLLAEPGSLALRSRN